MKKGFLRKRFPLKSGVLALLLACGTPFLFAAPNPILIESRSIASATESEESPILEDEGFGIETTEPDEVSAGEIHYQVQILQQEVQEIRGLLEELRYSLKRMQSSQDDRYLELDSRFQGLSAKLSSRSSGLDKLRVDSSLPSGQQTTTGVDQKTLFETAIELIRSRQYDLAITQLQSVISQYPDGALAPNAYYWLGEVYAAMPVPDYENARKALAQVITFFPEHRKVPDAAFKLGKVYHLMGDCSRARELLQQVVDQQKSKSVSKLADVYLREKVGDCQ